LMGQPWQGPLHARLLLPSGASLPYEKCTKIAPYKSVKPGRSPVNINGKAFFAIEKSDISDPSAIDCCHLATQLIKDIWKSHEEGKGKIDWTHYATVKSVAEHVPESTTLEFRTLKANAKRYNLIHNDDLGQLIITHFKAMLGAERRETLKTLLITSFNHAMVLWLQIKGTKIQPVFVVQFYDPNITNIPTRSETCELAQLKSHTLEQYINLAGKGSGCAYGNYYEGLFYSLVMECDLSSFTGPPPVQRKLTSFFACQATVAHLFFLLSNNFFEELEKVHIAYQETDENSQSNFLIQIIESTKGKISLTAALSRAMENRDIRTVKVWRKFLQLLPAQYSDQLAVLLQLKNSDSDSKGIFISLYEGDADVLKEYVEMVKLLPEAKRAQLKGLFKGMYSGWPGLFFALKYGHAEVIKVYTELLLLLPEEDLTEEYLMDLLPAITSQALSCALDKGHAEAILELGKFIRSFSRLKVEKIPGLLAALWEKRSWLHTALEKGKTGSFQIYGQFLLLFPEITADKLAELLAAKVDGFPGLYFALKNGCTEAILAYGELLQLFPLIKGNLLIELLAARPKDRRPGFYWGLRYGHQNKISAPYRKLTLLLDKEERRKLYDLIDDSNSLSYKVYSMGGYMPEPYMEETHQIISAWRKELDVDSEKQASL